MINVKKTSFEFDEAVEKGLISVTFEITGIERSGKEVLKWQLKEFSPVFEEQERLVIECSKFVKSDTIPDLIKEIEEYIKEKKQKIEKTLEDAFELRRFLNIISDAQEEAE
jgi:hypothetical protein